ncbi:DUF4435 domain-containing protein, partial [candidate division KSB1 bacterium]|nr:DUF4435 domain-containing protein [candidate division KSB1 bacterium]
MKELLTPHSIANTIRMKGSNFSGAFLIVEGPDDARLFKMFAVQECCKIEAAFGKHNTIESLRLLEESGFDRAVAIVDSDFDTILGREYQSERLFTTDTHDIETLIVKSRAFDKLIAEYADDQLLRDFEAQFKKNLRQALLEPAYFIGLARYISIKYQLNLSFKGIEFDDYLDKDTLQVDQKGLIKALFANSNNQDISATDLQKKLDDLNAENHDPWMMARGHDLVDVLLKGFRLFGYHRAQRLSRDMLESS